MRRFERDFCGEEARRAVLEECRIGRERYRVRGTPTVMLPDGRKLRHPIAFPQMKGHKVVGVLRRVVSGGNSGVDDDNIRTEEFSGYSEAE
jgi:hypothetical protein